MNEPQSDEKLTSYLRNTLPRAISPNHKCVSNSAILPSSQGSHLVYFAKDKSQGLLLVAINISIDEKENAIKIYPVKMDSSASLHNMVLEFSQCPYMPGAFAVLAYDPRQKALNIQKHVFLVSIMIDELVAAPKDQNQEINFYNINASKKIGTIKDIKWYPFATTTLLILTDTRILVYDLEQNIIDPSFDINLKNLQVVNASQVTGDNQFEKIGFAQKINQEDRYSSFGKKLSLYLASKTGAIYMVFPFVSYKVILDEFEAQTLEELRNLKVSFKKQQRALKMARIFQDSQLKLIPAQSELQKEKQFNLFINRPSKFKPQIFKLNSTTQNNKSSFDSLPNPYQKIQLFQPFTMGSHTLFMIGSRLKNNQYDFKTMIFSEDPYRIILDKPTYSRTQNFNIETVGEIKLDQATDNQKITYGNSLQLKLPKNTDNTELYLLHNNMTCYRVSLFRLDKFLSKKQEEKDLRLVDVDVVFDSKHKILTLSLNDVNIFVLKSYNDNYLFESIPLKSLELKEKINKTILETEELFKKLAAKPYKHQLKSGQDKKANLEQIKSAPLAEIEQKLKTFSQDYRASVERKLTNIKKLYEYIQTKNDQLNRQEIQKAEMIKLVNQAQQNQLKIKQLFEKKQKTATNRTQENIRRRILGASKMLDDIKGRIEREREETRRDSDKMDLMEQCEGQTDGVINKLQELKKQLIEKKEKLRRELGLERGENVY